MLLCRVYHVSVMQMKTPMTLGQKKAKMIEQLLEELGVGEESQTLNTTTYSSIVPECSSILRVYFSMFHLHMQVFDPCLLSRYACSSMS